MGKYCPRCRFEGSETDAFCSACGSALPERSAGPVPSGPLTGESDGTIAPNQVLHSTPPVWPQRLHSGEATADLQATVDFIGAAETIGPPRGAVSTRAHNIATATALTDRLAPGEAFGTRYHIIKLLAVGGMGAVYQAWDQELGVAVAIKTIRPDALAATTDAADVERRFKRELLLSREVTHANVLRIHDLGDVNGIKYITMPFVDGRDLASLLKAEGRLALPRALRLFRQIVAGVRAAHAKQIVHRDLKPANVMIEDEHVLVMDFGIARAHSQTTGMTVAGSVVGTLDYMAPEQAQGKPVDARADIYALGLILQDMLVGRSGRPQTDNAVTDLMMRMQAPPRPIREIDPQIPGSIEAIITRCLQVDPGARFQTTADLDAALTALDDSGLPRLPASPAAPSVAVRPPRRARGAIMAIAVAAMTTIGAAVYFMWPLPPAAVNVPRDPVSVLIANFDNRTGDAVFDGALEQVLALGIEGAAFITAYPRDQALRVVREIAPEQSLDEDRARLVSVREGIRLVLAGAIEPNGSGYRIAVRAIDGSSGAAVGDAEETADSKSDVIDAVGRAAKALRRDLGDATSADANAGSGETFTAGSIEAASAYARAQDLSARGELAEAITAYQQAIQRDPEFGRAYSGWATAAFRLGRPEEAEGLWKKALALMERMTEREKYRTLGSYYLGPGANDEQAITNFRALIERYPADAIGFNNLAVAYFNTLDFGQAVSHGRKVIEIFPKYRTARMNLALYMMYAGDLEAASVEARKALDLGPVDKAYLPLAVAALVANKPDEAVRAYADMAKTGARGASIASVGQADIHIYKGEYDRARAVLERGAAADEVGNQRAPRAIKLVALAEIALTRGARAEASTLVDQALALSRPDNVVVPAAAVLIALGRKEDARAIAADLEKQVRKRRRALGALIRAELASSAGRSVEAIDALTVARNLADLWLVRYALGKVYVEAGRYAEAVEELEESQKRKGEGAAAYLDDWPTFRYTVPVHYWLGRAQQGLGLTQSATKNFDAFLAQRGAVAGDPLAADARKRMTQR